MKNRQYIKDLLQKQITDDFTNENTTLLAEIISEFTDEKIIDWLSDANKELLNYEATIDFSYAFLRRKLEWEAFCKLTGVGFFSINDGYVIKDTEIFSVKESKAKEYNLI